MMNTAASFFTLASSNNASDNLYRWSALRIYIQFSYLMTYDEFVMAFVLALVVFTLGMYIIANNGDDDGSV